MAGAAATGAGYASPMLYLASRSPRRNELLARLDIPFRALDLDVPEIRGADESPLAYVRRVALDKARATVPIFSRSQSSPPPKPPDAPVLEITPAEAALGLTRRMPLARGRSIGLRLPAGLRTGETVRLAGQGDDGADLHV